MKTTLPAALLLLLQLATSAPIPIPKSSSSSSSFPRNCAYTPCHPSLVRLLSSGAGPHTPPTKLTAPQHWHLLSSKDSGENSPFDNSPYTPSSDISPLEALSSKRPLSPEYLRSLSNPGRTQHTIVVHVKNEVTDTRPCAAKASSTLPELRKADLERYWAAEEEEREQGMEGSTPSERGHVMESTILLPGEIYIKSRNLSQANDILVVVIVLMFLALVIAVEGAEKLVELKNYLTKPKESTSKGHGEIYLKYNEPSKGPLSIQASNTLYVIAEEKDSLEC